MKRDFPAGFWPHVRQLDCKSRSLVQSSCVMACVYRNKDRVRDFPLWTHWII